MEVVREGTEGVGREKENLEHTLVLLVVVLVLPCIVQSTKQYSTGMSSSNVKMCNTKSSIPST